MSPNCGVIVIFPIYGKMKASFRKPVSGRIVFKTYILSNSNFDLTKRENKTKKFLIEL